ncbi:MAG: ankyrin repeat domain-containing protein [Rhodocyclaceae bacterium]|jgi:ankyrin repeat protein|nr:ankyrin repeat domain-containing protein [Rhodocyclaceae bacterium]
MSNLNALFICVYLLISSFSTAVLAGAYEEAILAARDGRTAEIAALLQRGLDPNTTDSDGTTLLGLAARNGDLATVEMLLNHRASPNRRNRYGDTPLLLAANLGRLDLVKILHAGGGEMEPPGWGVLHYAVFHGHMTIVEYVLGTSIDVNRRAPNQRTALMLAAGHGNLEAVKLLLANGADPALTTPDQKTAAQIATEKGFVEVASFLLTVKGDPVAGELGAPATSTTVTNNERP